MKKFLLNVIFIGATLASHSASQTQKFTNLMSHQCTYCQKDDQLLKELQREGFELKSIGHCYGVTLTFIKYLTNNREKLNLSADALLDEFIRDQRISVIRDAQSQLMSMQGTMNNLLAENKSAFFQAAPDCVSDLGYIQRDLNTLLVNPNNSGQTMADMNAVAGRLQHFIEGGDY